MQELLNLTNGSIGALVLAGLVAYLTVIAAGVHFFTQVRGARRRRLRTAFAHGVHGKTIRDVSDAIDVYRGICPNVTDDSAIRQSIARILREIVAGEAEAGLAADFGSMDHAKGMLRDILEVDPFLGLPSADRSLLKDIDTYISNNETFAAKIKLRDLGGLIQARHDSLRSQQAINRWSVPIAVLGLVLNVVFGVLAW